MLGMKFYKSQGLCAYMLAIERLCISTVYDHARGCWELGG